MTSEWLYYYIPWRLCEAYRQQGWEIYDLWPSHHRNYMLAVREAV